MFKDYEYGWYGLAGSFGGKYFDLSYCQTYTVGGWKRKGEIENRYARNLRTITKQIIKLKDVVFIYGDYKEVI